MPIKGVHTQPVQSTASHLTEPQTAAADPLSSHSAHLALKYQVVINEHAVPPKKRNVCRYAEAELKSTPQVCLLYLLSIVTDLKSVNFHARRTCHMLLIRTERN